ncbi:hypothetical protein L3Q82_007913 [Scortum barcoo]|uniref:Uncharacterized protein n=1 Tax=Scortum barcoo TaxID=214431 RepID=A0ACB8WKC9_9TELE|nr:hypothetical protein L3Q82_007913 [Scortum barcoo]
MCLFLSRGESDEHFAKFEASLCLVCLKERKRKTVSLALSEEDSHKSREDSKEPPDFCLSESFTSPSCTLGVDLRRGRRRFSGNLQLPPLSWRQGERSRTPDEEIMARPTSLPFGAPPRIDITPVDPECFYISLIASLDDCPIRFARYHISISSKRMRLSLFWPVTVVQRFQRSRRLTVRTFSVCWSRFAAECEAAGMRISTSKSEAMVLDRKRVVACPLQVSGEVLPQVEEFKQVSRGLVHE